VNDPRPSNGYLLFCAEKRQESPERFGAASGDLPKEQTARLAIEWRALPHEIKAEYKARAAEAFREWKEAHPDAGYDTEAIRESAKLKRLRQADLEAKLAELTVGQKYGIEEVREFLRDGAHELRFRHEFPDGDDI
jgi:hypothetical protein